LVILGKRADFISALFSFAYYPVLFFALLLVTGCSSRFLDDREGTANQLVASQGWVAQNIPTQTFTLRSYTPSKTSSHPDGTLTVYIEGDGFAWKTRYTPSTDPTPDDPISLKLALADLFSKGQAESVAYLARPCQFTIEIDRQRCRYTHWTTARYSKQIIASMDQGVSALKAAVKAQSIRLVGYSGGGVVAALLAARRTDVTQLVTIAANLDTDYWTRLHGVSPLYDSLNPAQFQDLKNVPQMHYVGVEDTIVPNSVVKSFLRSIGRDPKRSLLSVVGADHECCWSEVWPTLQQQLISAR